MERHWWKESIVYQIYPRSFYDSNGDGIGDINGIIQKLDYLKNLGIDIIWLSPVYQSPNDDNGYDISDYQAILDEFGTMDDWELLLKEIHNRDMKLIMDLVVNHSSDEHKWFVESRKSKDNSYRDYYIWRPGKNGKEPNNWKSTFSGSAWKYDPQTDEYYLHIFSEKQPDLNWENPKLRNEVYNMMKWWLDKGIDGFRMDVINFISKVPELPDAPNPHNEKYVSGSKYFKDGPRIHEFLQEMNREVLSKYNVMTVGEMPGVNVEEAKKYTNPSRNELQMVFQFEHMDLDSGPRGKWDLKPLDLRDLKENISKWQIGLHGIGWNSLYLNNHDQPRMVSRFGNDKEYRVVSAKMLATLLHMLQGTPYIYQGEEIGMTNIQFESIDDYKDIEILNMYKEKVIEGNESHDEVMQAIYVKGRDNARTPFQWNDEKNGGFTTGEPWIKVNPNYKEINAEEAISDPDSIYHYYRELIRLRKNHDIIVYGDYQLLYPDDQDTFCYLRTLNEEKLLVITNFTEDEVTWSKPSDLDFTISNKLIGNYESNESIDLNKITLRPFEAIVYLGK
ncbi:glycoside hydrolase family 13 protein [Ornithinibacillus halotolerans]|uniref:oligo-1,6-glucosidase n=1 Tax=Ornithinibacillus halotolerans TaxID=1274357 RepID=A0A916WBW1_9BACI|nr:alpha-glucosidase [Ornithinibacillus halotolerans]GGA84441.1 oligo-1,6-glucosidase [Ornithinibacillus halotolerans]